MVRPHATSLPSKVRLAGRLSATASVVPGHSVRRRWLTMPVVPGPLVRHRWRWRVVTAVSARRLSGRSVVMPSIVSPLRGRQVVSADRTARPCRRGRRVRAIPIASGRHVRAGPVAALPPVRPGLARRAVPVIRLVPIRLLHQHRVVRERQPAPWCLAIWRLFRVRRPAPACRPVRRRQPAIRLAPLASELPLVRRRLRVVRRPVRM